MDNHKRYLKQEYFNTPNGYMNQDTLRSFLIHEQHCPEELLDREMEMISPSYDDLTPQEVYRIPFCFPF